MKANLRALRFNFLFAGMRPMSYMSEAFPVS